MAVSLLINGGDPNHLQVLGAHPPSRRINPNFTDSRISHVFPRGWSVHQTKMSAEDVEED